MDVREIRLLWRICCSCLATAYMEYTSHFASIFRILVAFRGPEVFLWLLEVAEIVLKPAYLQDACPGDIVTLLLDTQP